MDLQQFKEWATAKGYTEEQCEKYHCGGGAKRSEMFERGDEKEIEIKFKRWVGIVNSDKPRTPRKPKEKVVEINPIYQPILDYIKKATPEQCNEVLQYLEDEVMVKCHERIDEYNDAIIWEKRRQLGILLDELEDLGVNLELRTKGDIVFDTIE